MKILVSLFSLLLPVIAGSTEPAAELIIVEVSTGNHESASAEYVEIFNSSYEKINLENLKLQYKSATGANWITKSSEDANIMPRSRFLFSTDNLNMEYGKKMSSGLAGSAGSLRIWLDEITIDEFSWGEELLADEHQSYKRKVDEDGHFLDEWFISDKPSPSHIYFIEDEENEFIEDQDEKNTSPDPQPQNKNYPKITLLSFLADPASPLLDADDEYVSIKNPNNTSVNLEGYSIQSGSDFRYSYTFETQNLKPGEKLKLKSKVSGLVLSNSGSSIRVLDPNGNELSKVTYPSVKEGEVWSNNNGWSSNLETKNESTVTSVKGEVLSAETVQISEERDVYQEPTNIEPVGLNNSVLVAAGVLAIMYAVYEYRQDIRNRIEQFRRYLRNRKENRPGA